MGRGAVATGQCGLWRLDGSRCSPGGSIAGSRRPREGAFPDRRRARGVFPLARSLPIRAAVDCLDEVWGSPGIAPVRIDNRPGRDLPQISPAKPAWVGLKTVTPGSVSGSKIGVKPPVVLPTPLDFRPLKPSQNVAGPTGSTRPVYSGRREPATQPHPKFSGGFVRLPSGSSAPWVDSGGGSDCLQGRGCAAPNPAADGALHICWAIQAAAPE